MDPRAIERIGTSEAVNSRNTTDCGQRGLPQSMSVSDFLAILNDSRSATDQITVSGLQQSMSVSDLIGIFSDSAGENHPVFPEELENLRQQLLSDNNQSDTPDEKSLIPRVNSLFNLLYKDPNVAANSENSDVGLKMGLNTQQHNDLKGNVTENNRVLDPPASSSKQQGMLRKDSFSDLLLHLPRITSLPKFLSNISEEDGDAYNR